MLQTFDFNEHSMRQPGESKQLDIAGAWELVIEVNDLVEKIADSIEDQAKEEGHNSGILEHSFNWLGETIEFYMEWQSEALYDGNTEYANDYIIEQWSRLDLFNFSIENPEAPLFTLNDEPVIITDGARDYDTMDINYMVEDRLKEIL